VVAIRKSGRAPAGILELMLRQGWAVVGRGGYRNSIPDDGNSRGCSGLPLTVPRYLQETLEGSVRFSLGVGRSATPEVIIEKAGAADAWQQLAMIQRQIAFFTEIHPLFCQITGKSAELSLDVFPGALRLKSAGFQCLTLWCVLDNIRLGQAGQRVGNSSVFNVALLYGQRYAEDISNTSDFWLPFTKLGMFLLSGPHTILVHHRAGVEGIRPAFFWSSQVRVSRQAIEARLASVRGDAVIPLSQAPKFTTHALGQDLDSFFGEADTVDVRSINRL